MKVTLLLLELAIQVTFLPDMWMNVSQSIWLQSLVMLNSFPQIYITFNPVSGSYFKIYFAKIFT